MKALDRKLMRDLRSMWSQALTIALVVASGIGGFVASLSGVDSLSLARDEFYVAGRFADVFASLKRAPSSTAETLRQLPGVADVEVGVDAMVRIEMPNVSDPIVGQLIGIDVRRPPQINIVSISAGRALQEAIASDSAVPVLVNEGFFQARGLRLGDSLGVVMNGKRRTFRIVGTALSPEFIFAGLWGMPDQRGYGVFWLDQEVLSAAYDMKGAFNRLSVKLAPGSSQEAVAERLSAALAAYGGRDVHGRDQQTSHAMLDNEIKEQQVLGSVLPVIFLAVAAFLLNVVVSRVVQTQREQIAALKALGYTSRAIAVHYLKFVLVIVFGGLMLGIGLGSWLGAMLTRLYAEFFHFPAFEHRVAPWLVLSSAAVTVGAAAAGTLGAIRAVVRLAPADAMRPPAPGRYRPTVLERLGVRRIGPALRMILRNVERRPVRTGLSVAGIAAAVAVTITGNFVRDAIDAIVDTQFNLGLRGDVTLWTYEAVDDVRARMELARLPGVTMVESVRFVPVTLRHGHRKERSLLRGYPADPQLYRIVDVEGRTMSLADDGLVLTDRLATKLGVRPGDRVEAQLLAGEARTLSLPVTATVREMMGLNAYLDRRVLNRLMAEGDLSTGFVLSVERGREAALLEATKALPRSSGAFSKATMLRNMEEISARNVRIMSSILTAFAAVISIGVVYNNARIVLAERGWELASLRVLGFSRGEVSALLLGELALVIAVALPIGMWLGYALVVAMNGVLASDQFLFPVVILPRTYAAAALCVIAAGLASALLVRRRIDKLDLVAVLKTRD